MPLSSLCACARSSSSVMVRARRRLSCTSTMNQRGCLRIALGIVVMVLAIEGGGVGVACLHDLHDGDDARHLALEW